ncbi:cobyrinic acid a,c-diamide synthase [Ammoniphilus oxalaticus]|uniref:Cobyrinate a,c-diamide synthase n=1 Tax=Ammoniphilus oxalaticus TaxID=66863 RepID=A0A419SDF0_9BACL|nr:cobyrinate a,c-diamide synthase [Ammoniphilus oxalaticus]RKD21101.1 cobyrinic acid a,c-diamide synthase [Ammoniphilus oxalaticus]
MSARRIIVAGTGSGVGKTTVTIGLMAAYKALGYTVQGFKCGPDYIDPTYQTAVTGRLARNLDSWMFGAAGVQEVFSKGVEGAEIAIIEGVMGLFDGKDPLSNTGSAAEIAMITHTPILLVVDCGGMARSAAAVIKGFQTLSPDIHICGVVANQVGSKGHYELIRQAVEKECGIPIIGYLLRDDTLHMPERHLGLIPAIERGDLREFFDRLSRTIKGSFDLQRLYEVMSADPVEGANVLFPATKLKKRARIAVARDAAFHSYYPENLELLEHFGADIVYFSPLKGEVVPEEAHSLYIGGGLSEECLAALSEQSDARESVREAIASGMPVLAEGGGFAFLTQSIETVSGEVYPLVGIAPGKVKMQPRLTALGYREIFGVEGNFLLGLNDQAKGHEFHYFTFEPTFELNPCYVTKGMRGKKEEGILQANLVAGFTQIHFASNPNLAERWVDCCVQYKEKLLGL